MPITEAAIDAALLAASLMLCTTVPVTEEAALARVPDPFREAVAGFAADDLPAPELDVLAAELPAFEPVCLELPDFVAAGLAAAALDAPADAALDALDCAAWDFGSAAFAFPAPALEAAPAELSPAFDTAPDFLAPAEVAPPAPLAVLLPLVDPLALFAAALAVEAFTSFLGSAFAAAPVLFEAAPALLAAVLLDVAPFDIADFAEPPSVVPALGPADVAFAPDFFPAIVVPSPLAAQAAGEG